MPRLMFERFSLSSYVCLNSPHSVLIFDSHTCNCWGSGDTWGDRVGEMQVQLREKLCTSGGIAGFFNRDQSKYACIALKDGVHADFEVRRKGDATTLSDADCYTYLNREVEGCEKGGRREYPNWIFG